MALQIQQKPDIFRIHLDSRDINMDVCRIYRNLGYTQTPIPAEFSDRIKALVEKLPQWCDIQAGYRLLKAGVSEHNNGLNINGLFFRTGRVISRQLKHTEQVALCVCTIGPGMENVAKSLIQNGDDLNGYLVDSIATAAVETAADRLHNSIGETMHQSGLNITNRYSPGYCQWPVSDQQLFFSLLPDSFCGVRLTDALLMLPIKSVSGIIGIGVAVERRDYPCRLCHAKDCIVGQKRQSNHTANKIKSEL